MAIITIDYGDNIKAKRTIKKVSVLCTDELYLEKEITDDDGNVSTQEILKETSTKSFSYDSSHLNKLSDEFIAQAYTALTTE